MELLYKMNLSASDLKLLAALQENVTLSQIELAESSGLSRTSVWRRVRELEEAGVIENRVALLNPRSLGLQIHVLLSVSMVEHSDKIRQSFETHVERLPEVMECFSVSGDRDYVLQIISSDMES
jgi:Lrp/AsnC family transcriptional regulator